VKISFPSDRFDFYRLKFFLRSFGFRICCSISSVSSLRKPEIPVVVNLALAFKLHCSDFTFFERKMEKKIHILQKKMVGQDSVVGIETGQGLDGPGVQFC
jgi:hypothetical protein